MIWCRLALVACFANPAVAQEYITVPDAPLADDDFYRLVTCAAVPGKSCQEIAVRWPAHKAKDLSVGIVDVSSTYPKFLITPIRRALYRAILEVNGAETSLKMRRAGAGDTPDIAVYLVKEAAGTRLRDLPDPELNHKLISAGTFSVWWDIDANITRAVIFIARDIAVDEVPSIFLEEVVQATGLMTDIDSPWYASRSIFAEHSRNMLTRLQPQDIMALRRHYPLH